MKSLKVLAVVFLGTIYSVSAAILEVNSVESCSTKISIDRTIPVDELARGRPESPCTGYLKYEDRMGAKYRMCGDPDKLYHPAAKRACYTTGCNMARDLSTSGGVFDPAITRQKMLWLCFAYREQGVDLVDPSMRMVDTDNRLAARHGFACETGGDGQCFDDCHFGSTLRADSACTSDEPYWAITAMDNDECENGVLDYCEGPSESSCLNVKACGNNTRCTNYLGSYGCACEQGFEPKDGDVDEDPYDLDKGCIDTDECDKSLYPDTCGESGQCVNTLGSYICVCPTREVWNTDTKECHGPVCPSPPCDPNAHRPEVDGHPGDVLEYTCLEGFTAPDGSNKYSRTCIDGSWTDVSSHCTDVDECNPSQCDANADCTNTLGSFICKCREGFTGDGKTCTRVPCSVLPDIPFAVAGITVPESPGYGDEVKYTCKPGYQVSFQNLPYNYVDFYGSTTQTYFKLKCGADGHWSPLPLPGCSALSCGDPGTIAHAIRSGSLFTYNEKITYKCRKGYQPSTTSDGSATFTRTCQANGKWTDTDHCEDIDECEKTPGVCGSGQYCINSAGSYMCTCAPWQQENSQDNRCVEWAGLADFPTYKPCNILNSLGQCVHGKCNVDTGTAKCECDSGWTGAACDLYVYNPGLILGIVCLVLIFLLIIALIVYISCFYLKTHEKSAVEAPVYATHSPPPFPVPPPPGPRGFPMLRPRPGPSGLYK